jgi:hypothetical protein
MPFPVLSTSVQTRPCRRACAVMQRTNVEPLILKGEVYNCRVIAGTSTWSEHSWGNAVDLIMERTTAAALSEVAASVVYQATHRTRANRFRKLPVHEVIRQDRVWTRAEGWHEYTGEYHNHVHVDFNPYKEGKPPCAA